MTPLADLDFTTSTTTPAAAAKRPLRCTVCNRDFRRGEHLRRHARTHTHEKPFACPCGKAFSRQDLLRRHENKEAHGPATARQSTTRDQRLETPASLTRSSPDYSAELSFQAIDTIQSHGVVQATSGFLPESDWTQDDYTLFDPSLMLPNDFNLSSSLLLADFDITSGASPQTDLLQRGSNQHVDPVTNRFELEEPSSISRYGSPLPSLPLKASQERPPDTRRRKGKLTESEYRHIVERYDRLRHVLPSHDSIASRQALSRYLRGFLKGLNEHFPTLHIPTFSILRTELATLLAMATIGAHWCFEPLQSEKLFFATKAIVLHELNERDEIPAEASDNHPALLVSMLQALVYLMAAGTWGSARLLREALGLQSTAATLARELMMEQCHTDIENASRSVAEKWSSWISNETRTRTLLMAYCYSNVISLAYEIPPLILASEMKLHMPSHSSAWAAETAHEWNASDNNDRLDFQACMSSLFSDSQSLQREDSFTPLDNYISILTLLQRIFFLRQGSASHDGSSLNEADVTSMRLALQRWQSRWERSPDSTVDFPTWVGPIPFTSTAFLRLAWIRLYADLGPCRNLASRDPQLIADAFFKAPTVQRSSRVIMPILQAAYALAGPVQTGIEFVAKAQTVSWSVQHSLCNLECAIFLSKWLEELALTVADQPLTAQEQKILALIQSMMRETSLFDEDRGFTQLVLAANTISSEPIRMLATAVARVWAKIYSGIFAFPFANIVGTSLGIYAGLMEFSYSSTAQRSINV